MELIGSRNRTLRHASCDLPPMRSSRYVGTISLQLSADGLVETEMIHLFSLPSYSSPRLLSRC